ncbi:MAG: ribonuclease H-like domain-containing protein [Nitrospirae bacterium]|nr:ribonuclease H-like domain-containing protein [Nitrospirota bacterium]
MSKKIVLDIETIGKDFESFDELSREYLLKFAETEEEIKEAKDRLSFSPLTGEIVAIGLLNPETDKGAVYFQSPGIEIEPFEENGIKFSSGTEPDILRKFWEVVKGYDQVITFNGRGFDCPFIILRSAILGIRPSKDLMPSRYNDTHIDLLDHLSFFGAVRKKFNLHMWCRAFGIKSPKTGGITGYEIKDLFKEGRYLDIARYCTGDLHATKELFRYWETFIKF